MTELLQAKLDTLSNIANKNLIGIEKECLRVLPNGQLANSDHPKELGSTLTNPSITTDYAESQLEIITKPDSNSLTLINELTELHSFIYGHISNKNLLWPASIPGNLPNAKDILIAKYGTSAKALYKELYRLGLGYRYGKTMQLICGIHYNFSFGHNFYELFFTKIHNLPDWNQNNINSLYMSIIRNYQRISWLITYLFGASPAYNAKFIEPSIATANYLKPYKKTSYLAPYGTSIRESSLGYTNKNNVDLSIDYNSLNSYVDGLKKALSTPDPNFLSLGQYRYNKQIQINCNTLQIENEYYTVARPKPKVHPDLRPYKALEQHGIDYIEIRNIDLNPFSPTGIDKQQCDLLELIIYYCCFTDSPSFTDHERAIIKSNKNKTALLGRQPDLQLTLPKYEQSISLKNWANKIFADLTKIANLFDKNNNTTDYISSINHYSKAIENPGLTNSGKVYNDLINLDLDYTEYFLNQAIGFKKYYNNVQLSAEKLAYYNNLAAESIKQRVDLESYDQKHGVTLDHLLADV